MAESFQYLCNGDDEQMATLEELGWPKAVMERLDRHGELLTEVKVRLDREVQARLDAIIERQDTANGRTGKLEGVNEVLLARIGAVESKESMHAASTNTSRNWVAEIKWLVGEGIAIGLFLHTLKWF